MSEKKLFLLDGHALVYRAHFAFINRPLINSKGINTSAITGFVRTLWDLMKNQKPTHLGVCFDPKGPTFRHEKYEPYKANRDAQPEDISIAIPYITKIVEGFNIPITIVKGFEADDIIGTLAKQAEKEGFQVYMVTPDKDYAQLVSENIFMYKPSRQGNGVEILGVPEVLEKWDISDVDLVRDILGMQGDSVDNIPGLPGVGAKTAVKLLKEYKNLEDVLANATSIKGKLGEKIVANAEQGLLSKDLATINVESPVQFDADLYEINEMDKTALSKIFKELEFRTLAKTILGEVPEGEQSSLFDAAPSATQSKTKTDGKKEEAYQVVENNLSNTKHKYHLIEGDEAIDKLIATLSKAKRISFDTETTGIDPTVAEMVGLAFSIKKGEAYYVPTPKDQEEAKRICLKFKDLLESDKIEKVGQNVKYDVIMLKQYGIDVSGPFFDTMIAHYLVEPDLRHKLDYLTEAYLSYKMEPIENLIGKRGKNQLSMRDIDIAKVTEYAGEDADLTLQLVPILEKMLKENKLLDLNNEVELPLINVLRDIEFEGMKINVDFLQNYSKVIGKEIEKIKKKIYKDAGVEFNIASPKQVGEVLFDKLKIPYRWRKTSSGQYSTDVEKLTELAQNHQIVDDILDYRKFAKLKSTYVDALPLMVNPATGHVHSSFNQARAATGRLSSENPNLQNIPIRHEEGREIRKAFIPRSDDYILLAADYSQIELRLIAEISKDESMMDAFIKGLDIHTATAAKVYDVPLEEVSADQRRNAKTVNFSIIYGAGSLNLSKQLGIKRAEAKELIDQYFEEYKGLKKYMDEVVAGARDNGYVETLKGRRRTLRDINSRNGLLRSNAERVAINTPIQGTAADMIKLAMIKVHHAIKEKNLKSKMILQVHDELVFDAYKPELEELKVLVEENMKNALPGLKVPIVVGMGTGNNWLEAH